MEEKGNNFLKSYEELKANIRPTNFGFFRYKDLSTKDKKRLNSLQAKIEEYLDNLSNEELTETLLEVKDSELSRFIMKIINERNSYARIKEGWLYRLGLIPTFTEVTLFLMSLTFLLLLFFNLSFLEEFLDFILHDFDLRNIVVIIFFIVGLVVSIYYSFSKKKISRASKGYMLFFAVMINFIIAFFAGFYILENVKGFVIIFPIINIISAFVLLFLMRFEIITTKSILDKQAELRELAIGSLMVITVFIISQYIFHNYWAITFSLCLVYANNINHFIEKWIFS